jgi:DNA topoisomerase IA
VNGNSDDPFGRSQGTFKKRTTSVSKPVDKNLMETFKNLVDQCATTTWEKRLKAIENLQDFAESSSKAIRNTAASNFIKLVDTYCSVLQDNNLKVQTKA